MVDKLLRGQAIRTLVPLVDVPAQIRPELAERYRQMRPFEEAETALVHALIAQPDQLSRQHEVALRQALNLARLWVVPGRRGEVVVGPQLGAFRDYLRPLARSLAATPHLDPKAIAPEAEKLRIRLAEQKQALLSRYTEELSPTALDKEICEKALVLAVGGGGGCGYVHLGAFALLEALKLKPALMVGSSIGSILALFRARDPEFREGMVRAVTSGLAYKNIFRVLDAETRYAMPGALRLHLRGSLARFFVGDHGEPMRMGDLKVPFICTVTGLRREAMREVQQYERMFLSQMRRGTFGRLLHIKDLIKNVSVLLSELLATPGALTAVPLGQDAATKDFDVIDAVGFSAAVPAIIQYDITRDDPRMHTLMRSTLDRYGVDVFADGGLVSNVPARIAWEHVQLGRIQTRNAFVMGLDCFSPQMGRNVLYLPLQRVAAENVAQDRPFSQFLFSYRKVLSATSLVPKQQAVTQAMRNGRDELSKHKNFILKMMEKLPSLPGPGD